MATRVTEDDLLAAIREYGKELPKRPEGKQWETIAQMAKRAGKSISAMRYQLTLALQHGLKVERFVGSDYDQAGTLVKQTWFKVKR